MKAKLERTGWRDEKLSARHRLWGVGCPALDIDFLMIEYESGIPTALVEYKNEHAQIQKRNHPSYQALIKLGDSAEIPVFFVRYATDFSWWRVSPLNDFAKKYIESKTEMDERSWIEILYNTRKKKPPRLLEID